MNSDIMVLIALLCLRNGVTPRELDELAHQLAAFEAINDARTGREYVACN
ncbi:hypothetical protein [Sodalis sp. dw_96]|nr:hypothetical protein [Sodalis sp. dw_96]